MAVSTAWGTLSTIVDSSPVSEATAAGRACNYAVRHAKVCGLGSPHDSQHLSREQEQASSGSDKPAPGGPIQLGRYPRPCNWLSWFMQILKGMEPDPAKLRAVINWFGSHNLHAARKPTKRSESMEKSTNPAEAVLANSGVCYPGSLSV